MSKRTLLICSFIFVTILIFVSYFVGNMGNNSVGGINNLDNIPSNPSEAASQFPEFLNEEIEHSLSYAKAKELHAVIAINGEIITSKKLIDSFMEAVKVNGEAELYHFYYTFSDHEQQAKSLLVTRFSKQRDFTLFQQVFRATSEENLNPWDQIPDFSSSSARRITSLELSPYGTLIYTSDDIGSEVYSVNVINKREVFADWDERLQLADSYLNALAGSRNLEDAWTSPQELKDLFFLFEDIYTHKAGGRLADHFEVRAGDWVVIPVHSIEETLSAYFDGITRELILESSPAWYNKELDAIIYGGGCGGEAPKPLILSHETKGSMMSINYILLNPNEVPIDDMVRRLTVELDPDGSFIYRSNEVLESLKHQ